MATSTDGTPKPCVRPISASFGAHPPQGDFDYAEDMFVSIDHVVAAAKAGALPRQS